MDAKVGARRSEGDLGALVLANNKEGDGDDGENTSSGEHPDAADGASPGLSVELGRSRLRGGGVGGVIVERLSTELQRYPHAGDERCGNGEGDGQPISGRVFGGRRGHLPLKLKLSRVSRLALFVFPARLRDEPFDSLDTSERHRPFFGVFVCDF